MVRITEVGDDSKESGGEVETVSEEIALDENVPQPQLMIENGNNNNTTKSNAASQQRRKSLVDSATETWDTVKDSVLNTDIRLNLSSLGGKAVISCDELMRCLPPPAKVGYAEKKSNSIWSFLLPWFFPSFKTRFFVLIGSYLFRYGSESDEKTKGVPIPIEQSEIKALEDDETGASFQISIIRKTYVIRCESKAECVDWVNKLRMRRASAIRESLGHAPLSESVKRVNQVAQKLFTLKIEKEREDFEREQGDSHRLMTVDTKMNLLSSEWRSDA